MLLSICVPSYNRPEELKRLLESIDSTKYAKEIEVIIQEDKAPKRQEVREVVQDFIDIRNKNGYEIKYFENEENCGYDKNLRTLPKRATGEYVMYMGDDDMYVPGALDEYLDLLLKEKPGYILRRYRTIHKDNSVEEYRYSKENVFFRPGEDAYVELFRRSLFISGFTFRRGLFSDYDCDIFDGTLLFQLYIQATICLTSKSAYFDIPITQQIEGGIPYFGKSESEKGLYTSGSNTVEGSLNFMRQVIYMAEKLDEKLNVSCSQKIIESYSKYSYGFLLEHRDDGVKTYKRYAKGLKELGFACTSYFYIYYYLLLIFGKRGSAKIIMFLKKIIGKTPRL
ncbi:MAG: glycosyltransferase [Eubacterium sp.]|nr:glycosyltransferase [Eubacterium sp.]